MNIYIKVILIMMVIAASYTLVMYHPAIMASFDEFKYIDREVFTPLDGEYDFRKFTLESPGTHNYTAYISCSGYV